MYVNIISYPVFQKLFLYFWKKIYHDANICSSKEPIQPVCHKINQCHNYYVLNCLKMNCKK